jgi:hypothetical protein
MNRPLLLVLLPVIVSVLLVSALIAVPVSLSARVLHVPDPYPRIQLAIDAAIDDDTVLVAPGTYEERIDFLGKPIVVGSWLLTTGDPSYVASTIIEPQEIGDFGPVVTFARGESTDTVIRGFTIQNGTAVKGGGVYCYDTSPQILENVIRWNWAEQSGGGVYDSLGSPILTGNIVEENQAQMKDGGGFFSLYAAPTIEQNTFRYNISGYRGAGVYCEHSSPTIIENTVYGNSGPGYYAGGVASRNCDSIIIGNTIYENDGGGYGGGLFY